MDAGPSWNRSGQKGQPCILCTVHRNKKNPILSPQFLQSSPCSRSWKCPPFPFRCLFASQKESLPSQTPKSTLYRNRLSGRVLCPSIPRLGCSGESFLFLPKKTRKTRKIKKKKRKPAITSVVESIVNNSSQKRALVGEVGSTGY